MDAPAKVTPPVDRYREWKMWARTLPFVFLVFDFWLVYIWVYLGEMTFAGLANVLAATAAILIGSSFALSGLSYFFNLFDRVFVYRKYLGLTGYFLALGYSILLLWIDPTRYFYGFWNNLHTADFVLGLTAMKILTMMALISTRAATVKLGKYWRPLMRLGYLAYFLLIVRAYVLEHEAWFTWAQTPNTLPPPRIVLSLFALTVILLRLALQLDKLLHKGQLLSPQSPTVETRKSELSP